MSVLSALLPCARVRRTRTCTHLWSSSSCDAKVTCSGSISSTEAWLRFTATASVTNPNPRSPRRLLLLLTEREDDAAPGVVALAKVEAPTAATE